MKRDPSQTAESKIRIVPITAPSQKANSRVSIGFEEGTINAHSRKLPGGQAVTQFPGANALPVPQAGVMSVGPISNLPLQTQGQTFPYATPRDYVDDGGAPYPVQATSRASNAISGASNATSNATEVVPASGDVLATAKLVATCTAAATAAVLASSGVSDAEVLMNSLIQSHIHTFTLPWRHSPGQQLHPLVSADVTL